MYADAKDWLVTKKQPGVWSTQTAQYATFAYNPTTCHARTAFEDAKNYIAQHGCIYVKGIEVNGGNGYDANYKVRFCSLCRLVY